MVQKSLPRPSTLDINSLTKAASTIEDPVEKAIAQEMAILISNDALEYPVPGAKTHGSSRPLETFDDSALSKARLEIARELLTEDAETRHVDFENAWQEVHNHAKLPGLSGYADDEIDEHQLMVETFDVSSSSRSPSLPPSLPLLPPTLHTPSAQVR